MSTETLRRARRDYRCFFCGFLIFKSSRYWQWDVTPWDHPDNDGFGHYKVHKRCAQEWHRVADLIDYSFPYYDRRWHRDMAQNRRAKVIAS